MPRISDQQIADELLATKGMIYVAARRLGCNGDTIKRRLAKSAALRAVREEARGMAGDAAELKLFEAIQKREPWAIQFYLKTQHKDRGYGDELRITVRERAAIIAAELGLDPAEVIAEAEAVLRQTRTQR